MKVVRNIILGGLLSLSLASAPVHADSSTREFIMSCTYGVLAGTLVGAALLAFTDQPGENLNKVARGASIGLYSGILLGLYVVYGVNDEPEEPDFSNGPSEGWRRPAEPNHRFALLPTGTIDKIDGAMLSIQF